MVSIGQRIGRLTVIKQTGWKDFPSGKRHRVWLCRCDCGKEIQVTHCNLKPTHTTSCGCYQAQRRIESHTKHGHTKNRQMSKIYIVWKSMLQRCNDPNAVNYERYGARGIRVLWTDFKDFVRDMEKSWKPGLQIERKDNEGPYCKENCTWATAKEQARNRRSNRVYTVQGVTGCLWDLAKHFGIKRQTVEKRLDDLGWPIEKAFTHPVRNKS